MNAEVKIIYQSVLDKLKLVSTPAVATVLYGRGLRCQMIQDVLPLGPIKQSMVGIAYTLRYIPAREDLNQITVFSYPKHLRGAAIDGWSTACPSAWLSIRASDGMHNFRSDSSVKR